MNSHVRVKSVGRNEASQRDLESFLQLVVQLVTAADFHCRLASEAPNLQGGAPPSRTMPDEDTGGRTGWNKN